MIENLLSSGWIRRMRRILVQFHQVESHMVAKRCALRLALAATHEELWTYPWIWEEWALRHE